MITRLAGDSRDVAGKLPKELESLCAQAAKGLVRERVEARLSEQGGVPFVFPALRVCSDAAFRAGGPEQSRVVPWDAVSNGDVAEGEGDAIALDLDIQLGFLAESCGGLSAGLARPVGDGDQSAEATG